MKVITLIDVTLDSSNVTGSSYSEYNSGTTYAATDNVKVSFESDGTTPIFPVLEYTSITSSNTGNYPPDSLTDWSLLGAENKGKMFDGSITSQTSFASYIEVEIDASNTNAVGVLNMDAQSVELTHIVENELITDGDGTTDAFTKETGWAYGGSNWSCDGTQVADSRLYQSSVLLSEDLWVQVVFTVSGYSAGNIAGYAYGNEGTDVSANGTYTQVFQVTNTDNTYIGLIADSDFIGTVDDISVKFVPKYESVTLGSIEIADYWYYFFGSVLYLSDILWYYPSYGDATLRIKISNSASNAECGLVVLGGSYDFGFTQWQPTIGIIDYSIKTTDSLGRTTLSQGDFANRIDAEVQLETNSSVDSVKKRLTLIRGTPALWDFNNDDVDKTFESLILYGYYEKFDEIISNWTDSICIIRINGLT